ncbi:hypothetical protein L1887_54828 [Cichorium endivia]|nr:hypothetical protein L1887_54828 [Cichorium endivia]
MSASADPYLLASTILTPDELPKLALVTYDAAAHLDAATSSSDLPPPHLQRIFVIVSNVTLGVEQSCVLVIKPRRKDPTTAALLSVIPILPDLKIEIEPQQGLTASAATPRNHPPAATTLGLSSLPQSLPTIHTLLESVVPDLFAPDKAATSNAALRFSLSFAGQSAEGITSDARGLKDFLSVLKDLLKVAQQHAFSAATTHQWMSAYTQDLAGPSREHAPTAAPHLDTPVFSRLSHSSFVPSSAEAATAPARPASPTANDIRISVGTFNVNGQLPREDIPTIVGLKRWLRAEEDPDLIVLGFQELDTSSGAYLYYSPARQHAWTHAITQALGRRAPSYRKIAAKQLVGLLILVFARAEVEHEITDVACRECRRGTRRVRGEQGRSGRADAGGQQDTVLCQLASVGVRRIAGHGETVLGLERDLQAAQEADREHEAAHDDAVAVTAQAVDASSEQTKPTPASDRDSRALSTPPTDDSATDPAWHSGVDVSTASTSDVDGAAAEVPSTPFREQSILEHDVVFHFGDLNFRLDLSHSEAHRLIRARQYTLLHRYDQLESLRTSGALFDDFLEAPLTFAPTYKFDLNTDRYDTSDKQRIPAWTDRILWSVTCEWTDDGSLSATAEAGDKERRLGVVQQSYECVSELKFSDHRAVRATFVVRIR